MSYIGAHFVFKCSSHLPYEFDLCVSESPYSIEHVLTITVSGKDIHETLHNIPLEMTNPNNCVYKSQDLRFTHTLYYENYQIESFRVLLKFRNNKLSPVSTLYVTCILDEGFRQTQRLYALTLDEIEAHCVSMVT